MAQNPDARFQSASEFRTAIAAALQPVVPAQTSVPQSTPPQPAQPAPPLPPAPQKTNWTAILLGIVLVIVLCGGSLLLFNWWNNQDGDDIAMEPTSPPAEIVPTDEPPEPTQEPEPTREPEATQEPRPTRTPRPTREPGEPGEPPELPEVCNSAGFAGGFFILGSVLMVRKRSISKRRRYDEK